MGLYPFPRTTSTLLLVVSLSRHQDSVTLFHWAVGLLNPLTFSRTDLRNSFSVCDSDIVARTSVLWRVINWLIDWLIVSRTTWKVHACPKRMHSLRTNADGKSWDKWQTRVNLEKWLFVWVKLSHNEQVKRKTSVQPGNVCSQCTTKYSFLSYGLFQKYLAMGMGMISWEYKGPGKLALSKCSNYSKIWKKCSEETQTLRAGCSKGEPKIFTPPQTPFPGRDGQNLISWRWSLPLPTNPVWRGSMHTISSYRGNRPTHTPTHRLQYTVPQLACSVKTVQYWQQAAVVRSVYRSDGLPVSQLALSEHSGHHNVTCRSDGNKRL